MSDFEAAEIYREAIDELSAERDRLRAIFESDPNRLRAMVDELETERDDLLVVQAERDRLRAVIEAAIRTIEQAQFKGEACEVCDATYRVLGDQSIAAVPSTRQEVSAMSEIDLDAYQAAVGRLWEALHPDETISDIGNSLAEESGEVNRAIIKRRRGSSRSDDWDRDLRHETIDVLINLMAVAWKEGYSLGALLVERWPRYADEADINGPTEGAGDE